MSKPLKELPGFAAAFTELVAFEAGQGWWCDYGFSLGELGNLVVPRLACVPDAQTLGRFAQAISNALPPYSRRRGHVHLVAGRGHAALSSAPGAANDCEAW